MAADEREPEQPVRPAMARASLGVDPETVILVTIEQVADAFGEVRRLVLDARRELNPAGSARFPWDS